MPGMGVIPPLSTCGTWVITGIESETGNLRTAQSRCKSVSCPKCGFEWENQTVFKLVCDVLAYGELIGHKTPAHIVFSPPFKKDDGWTQTDIACFIKRGYARLGDVGVNSGKRLFHAFRVKGNIKDKLKRLGYAEKDVTKPGYWSAIRDDVLKLGDFRKYVYFSPHIHIIGFPSFIKSHSDDKYLLKKIGELKTPLDILKNARYLVSHLGVFDVVDELQNKSVVDFGIMKYFNPETPIAYHCIPKMLNIEESLSECATNVILDVYKGADLRMKDVKRLSRPVYNEILDILFKYADFLPLFPISQEDCDTLYLQAVRSKLPPNSGLTDYLILKLFNFQRQITPEKLLEIRNKVAGMLEMYWDDNMKELVYHKPNTSSKSRFISLCDFTKGTVYYEFMSRMRPETHLFYSQMLSDLQSSYDKGIPLYNLPLDRYYGIIPKGVRLLGMTNLEHVITILDIWHAQHKGPPIIYHLEVYRSKRPEECPEECPENRPINAKNVAKGSRYFDRNRDYEDFLMYQAGNGTGRRIQGTF